MCLAMKTGILKSQIGCYSTIEVTIIELHREMFLTRTYNEQCGMHVRFTQGKSHLSRNTVNASITL